jgi:transposase
MSAPKGDMVRNRAALLLAAGRSRTEVAEITGVARRTLTRWLADPEFQRLVRKFGDQFVQRTLRRLSAAGVRATKILERVAAKRGTKDEVRVSAADKILKHLLRGFGVVELNEKLDALRELAEEVTRARPKV